VTEDIPALRYGLDIIAFDSYKRYCLDFHKANSIHSWGWLAMRIGKDTRRGTVHRNITSATSRPPEDRLGDYAYAFGLKKRRDAPENDATRFFKCLYKHEHAEDPETRRYWRAKIEAMRFNRQIARPRDLEQRLFAHWSIPAIAEMTHHPDFEADAEWLSARLFPTVTVEQAEHALRELVSLGLFEYSLDGGLEPPKGTLLLEVDAPHRPDTPADAMDELHAWYGEQAASLARDPAFPRHHRDFRAVNVALPDSALPAVKKLMQETAANVVAIQKEALERGESPDRVYAWAMHLMPVTRQLEGESDS